MITDHVPPETRPQTTHHWLTKFLVPHHKLKGLSCVVFASPLFPSPREGLLFWLSLPPPVSPLQLYLLDFKCLYMRLSWEQGVCHVHLYFLSICHSAWLMTLTRWPIFWFINNGSRASQAWMWLLWNHYPQPSLSLCMPAELCTFHWMYRALGELFTHLSLLWRPHGRLPWILNPLHFAKDNCLPKYCSY